MGGGGRGAFTKKREKTDRIAKTRNNLIFVKGTKKIKSRERERRGVCGGWYVYMGKRGGEDKEWMRGEKRKKVGWGEEGYKKKCGGIKYIFIFKNHHLRITNLLNVFSYSGIYSVVNSRVFS